MINDIIPAISRYIAAEILRQPDRQLSSDEQLISSGMIDSLSLVDIAIFIEEQFQVTIEDTELNAETFDTLDELEAIILSRQK